MKRLLFLLMALLWPAICSASWQAVGNGYYVWTTSYGNDGYYYTRNYTAPYWYNGCYYAGSYNYVRSYQIPVTQTVNYSSNWKSDILKAVEKRADSKLFLQALRESGLASPAETTLLEGNGITNIKGTSVYQSGYYPFAQQGNTLVSLKDYSPNIGHVDIQGAFNQISRIAEQSITMGDNMAYALSQGVGQVADAQLQIAKVQEAGKVAVALAQTSVPPKQVTTKFEAQVGASSGTSRASATGAPPGNGNPPATPQPDPPDAGGGPSALGLIWTQGLMNNACAKCHNPEKAKGGLDLSQFDKWDADRLAEYGPKIAARVTSRDPEFQMPPPDSGIKPLTPLEIKKLLDVLPLGN